MFYRNQSPAESAGLPVPGNRTGDRASVPALQRTLTGALRIYQRWVSPCLPSSCRFHPTCSEYMRQAIVLHGSARGVGLGLIRLAKCHPFHPGGVDCVPEPNSPKTLRDPLARKCIVGPWARN